jgi:hypothetical protein
MRHVLRILLLACVYDWHGIRSSYHSWAGAIQKSSSADRSFFLGGMGVMGRLAVSWQGASFAVVAALAWLSATFVSCPLVRVEFMSKVGVQITAAIPSPGPIMVLIADDDREFQEDDLELCALPGVRLIWPPSLTLSQITPPQSVSLSVLAPTQRPLRC